MVVLFSIAFDGHITPPVVINVHKILTSWHPEKVSCRPTLLNIYLFGIQILAIKATPTLCLLSKPTNLVDQEVIPQGGAGFPSIQGGFLDPAL